LGERERRWAQEASYGTIRLRGRLDFLLDLHLTKGLKSVSPLLLDHLRLGAYQLHYMAGVPAYAALSQTVDQVAAVAGKGGARLANGVLRSLQSEGGAQERFPAFETDPLAHLSTWGSHPSWMVRRWLDRWPPEEVRKLVDLNNQPPPLYFRPLGLSLTEAAERLNQGGWACQQAGSGVPCLLVADGTDPARLLEAVPGIVQDPGAALVTEYAQVVPDTLVADLCAAPGGKALALASGGSPVLAADRSWTRLRVMKENVTRVGIDVKLVAADAQAPPFSEVPFVLLDVPCTGTGTLRRHPDARWRLALDTLKELTEVQGRILQAGSRLVPKGGHLVYSTCTLEPEENEEQVADFLKMNPQFTLESTGAVEARYLDADGYLRVLPQSSGFDGSFGARMVRSA
jgi:16S rRNA (cytosine967-C5)-methyltransferase